LNTEKRDVETTGEQARATAATRPAAAAHPFWRLAGASALVGVGVWATVALGASAAAPVIAPLGGGGPQSRAAREVLVAARRPVASPSPSARRRRAPRPAASPSPTGNRRRVRPSPSPKASPRPAASPTPAAFKTPALLWKTFLKRVDATAAVVASSDAGTGGGAAASVFVAANNAAHRLDDGRTQWSAPIGASQSAPTVDDTAIYIGSDAGTLFKLSRQNGKSQWKFPTGNSILTRPVVFDGRVYAESTDNNVYAVDAQTGASVWKFVRPDGSLGYSSPVYTSTALLVCGESTLYALAPATGKPVWQAPLGGKSASAATVGGGRVVVGTDGRGLQAFALATGKPAWSFAGDSSVKGEWFGSPLHSAGSVYVSTYNRFVYAVDAVTGKAKWSARITGAGLARPAVDEARGVVYVTCGTFRNNPSLWALSAKTGKTLWNVRLGNIAAAPVIEDGRLYVGSTDGYFYAYSLK